MALKQDERALLQLICERGQSYGDLAELLDIPEQQVRDRARGALRELGGADPDAEVGLTDYLLGQADPIGRADAVRHLQGDPDARELAATIATKLTAIAPGAELPRLPEPRGKRRKDDVPGAAATVPPTAERGGSGAAGTGDRRLIAPEGRQARLLAAAVGGAVVLLFAILAIAGVFSGDDSEAPAGDALAEEQREVTSVELSPQGGSGVAGQADFGLANDQLFVDLDLDGLDPEPDEDSVYVLWLMLNRNGGYPVSIVVPGEAGSVQDRYAVPTPVAVAVASNARSVQVSLSPSRQLRREINEAVEAGAPLVPFQGDVLARGRIPLAEGEQGAGGEGEQGAEGLGGLEGEDALGGLEQGDPGSGAGGAGGGGGGAP
jgi:hypothetical protein